MADPSTQYKLSGANLGGFQIGQQYNFGGHQSRLQIITEWFSPLSFSQRQKDVYKSEYATSKESFFSLNQYESWERGDINILWCQGTAGCGKTVLVSMIYERLRSIRPPTAKCGIACIYCDIQQKDDQSPENLLASVWPEFHLTHEDETVPSYMDRFYQINTRRRTRPDISDIQSVIQEAIARLEKAYILIDGLDEYTNMESQTRFMRSIKVLLERSRCKLSVIITSRQRDRYFNATYVDITASDDEIMSVVQQRILSGQAFGLSVRQEVMKHQDLQNMVVEKIVSKAKGMFLIAELHIKSLSSIHNIRDLRQALQELPDTIDQQYEKEWGRILEQESRSKAIAQQTVSWVYHACRHLKVEELCHALAVRPGDKSFESEGVTSINDIIHACQGLVIVEQHSHFVRLVHSTTHEFFQNHHGRLFTITPTHLTRYCLTYLCLDDFNDKLDHIWFINLKHQERKEYRNIVYQRRSDYPFLYYAATHWADHARGEPEQNCGDIIFTFLKSNTFSNNAHMVSPQVSRVVWSTKYPKNHEDLFPVRVAISFHLQRTACQLVESDFSPDEKPQIQVQWYKAFSEAISTAQPAIAKALLKAGLDPFISSEWPIPLRDQFDLPDSAAVLNLCVNRNANEIVDMLMLRGGDQHITRETVKSAVSRRNTAIICRYVSMACDNNENISRLNDVLHAAASSGNLDAIEYSLDRGAHIDCEQQLSDVYTCTALGSAVIHGQFNAVQCLLNRGADQSIGVKRNLSDAVDVITLLEEAATTPFTSFEYVEENGESIENWEYCISEKAEGTEFGDIITLLLDRGANIFIRGKANENLLHMSVTASPRLRVVLQHLRCHPEIDFDVNVRDENGRIPIHYAAARCRHQSMELLIQNGADVSIADEYGVTVLYFSVCDHHCVDVALRHGCQANQTHLQLGTPLEFFDAVPYSDPCARTLLQESLEASTVLGGPQLESMCGDVSLAFTRTSAWIKQKSKWQRRCNNRLGEMQLLYDITTEADWSTLESS